jgi:MFS family permease
VGGLVGFLYKDYSASNTEIATFGSITSLLSVWLNPVCSTWSDRMRTRYGRRRPFILLATPFFALFLMLMPYMPDFFRWIDQYPVAARLFDLVPVRGEVMCIFICGLAAGAFNAMVLAIFSYLYWDVVPVVVLGRFNALGKIVTGVAVFLWNFFFFGLGQYHMKGVFIGVSIFCLLFYMISTWQIKEGDYPPVDPHTKGGIFAPIRAYCVECFSQPYFLWIFLGFTLYQINNLGNQYQGFYLFYNLGLSMDVIGKMRAVPLILAIVLAFVIGTMTDKFNPVRLLTPTYLVFLVIATGTTIMSTTAGIVTAALMPRIYPMEKLGQYCSASALSQQVACALVGPAMGRLFDCTSNRFGFLWSADFLFAAALVFQRVQSNWKKRHGHAPHPHAG